MLSPNSSRGKALLSGSWRSLSLVDSQTAQATENLEGLKFTFQEEKKVEVVFWIVKLGLNSGQDHKPIQGTDVCFNWHICFLFFLAGVGKLDLALVGKRSNTQLHRESFSFSSFKSTVLYWRLETQCQANALTNLYAFLSFEILLIYFWDRVFLGSQDWLEQAM